MPSLTSQGRRRPRKTVRVRRLGVGRRGEGEFIWE